MELIIGVILGVLISFFAIFLTKRMSIAEERLHSEHVREMQHERLLTEILDHLRSLEHHPRSRAP